MIFDIELEKKKALSVGARIAVSHTDTLVYRAGCTRSLVFQVWQ